MVRVQVKNDINHLFYIDLSIFQIYVYSWVCMLIIQICQNFYIFLLLHLLCSVVFYSVSKGNVGTKFDLIVIGAFTTKSTICWWKTNLKGVCSLQYGYDIKMTEMWYLSTYGEYVWEKSYI